MRADRKACRYSSAATSGQAKSRSLVARRLLGMTQSGGAACAIGGRQEGLSLLGTNPRHKRRAVATWGGGWKSECRPWGPALAEGEAWRLFVTWLPAIERDGDGAQFLRDLCSKGTGQRPVATSAGRNDRQECLPLLGTNPRHKRRAVATWGGDGKASAGLGGLHSLKEKPGDSSLPGCLQSKEMEMEHSSCGTCARRGQARGLSLLRQGETTGRNACRYLEQTHGTNGVPWLPGGGMEKRVQALGACTR